MSMFPQFLAANHPTLSTEDLLFNIGCLDDSKKEIVGIAKGAGLVEISNE